MHFAKNPFPGMNPWLESYWGDIHTRLTMYSCDSIQRQLPSDLHARVEEYLSVDEPYGDPKDRHRRISPDIHISKRVASAHLDSSLGATAVALDDTLSEPIRIRRIHEPDTLRYIEILDLKASRRVVTAIEFLSPANKTQAGRKQYVQKQSELIYGDVSLVEIDLLRDGIWVMATCEDLYPVELRRPYRICVTRRETTEVSEVYKASFRSPLPDIRIPLRENEPDIRLPLQSLVNLAYENGRYGNEIDYSKPPEIALDPLDEPWIQSWLSQQASTNV